MVPAVPQGGARPPGLLRGARPAGRAVRRRQRREPNGERPAQQFEEEFGITYPSVYDPKGDALLSFRDTVPPKAIPSTLVIDREGRIAARILGAIGEASLTDIVGEIAAETPAAEGTAESP